jgi:hypothetical protein
MWYEISYSMVSTWTGNRVYVKRQIKADNVAGAKKEVMLRWPKNDVKITKVVKMAER